MNEIEIDLSKCIDNFKIDKDKAEQYGGYEKIANDLSKENIKLAFENTILQSKIDKAIEYIEENILDNKIEKVNWDYDECYYSDMPTDRIKPLIDILKEAENVKNN